MLYYKDTNNNLYAFNDNAKQKTVNIVAKKHNTILSQITEEEYKQFKAPSLDQLKSRKKNEIETTYNTKTQEPIEYKDTIFQADSKSQDILTKVITSAPEMFEINWLDIDNNPIHLTLDELKELAELILTRSQEAFAKKVELKKQIEACTTEEELGNIKWD